MNIMTKRGSQDNVVTYEHYCDTKEDLTAIPNDQITLGSTAVVLKDEGDAMGVYMANSSKEWIPFSSVGNAGGSSGGGGSTGGVMKIYGTKHYGEEHNVYYTADKSFDDVASFIENGGIPVLIIDETKIAQCEYILRNEDFIYEIGFSRTKIEEDSIKYMEYMCYPDDTTSIPKYIGYAETSYGGSDGGDDPIPPVG